MVSVRVTVLAALSAALGLYVAVRLVLLGVKVPVPPDHVAEVALPPIDPASIAFAVAHIP